MKKYKAVFFDWNGTLSTSKFWGHLEKSTPENKKLFERIDKTLFGELRYLIKPWMKGELKSEDVIKEISINSEIDQKRIFDEFVISCQKMEYVSDSCIKMIKQIKNRNIKVVIATDNMDSFVRWTVPAMKLDSIFDDILDSFTIKAMKNDFDSDGKSVFFDNYMKKSQITKGESVLIDDSEDKDGKIESYGIDYLQIEAGVGLIPALERIIRDTTISTSA